MQEVCGSSAVRVDPDLTHVDDMAYGSAMESDAFADLPEARKSFVLLLEEAKRLFGSGSSGEGPNKIVARKIGISPARLGEFLKLDHHLLWNKDPTKVGATQFRKIVTGFATSVARSLLWLESEKITNKGELPDPSSIVGTYWPEEVKWPYRSPLGEQAIREGINIARGDAKSIDSIKVKLWIAQWGVADVPSDEQLKKSFFVRYGKAVFRGIDPSETIIEVESKPLAKVLEDLPLRSSRGDWAVSVGTYDLLDRRFAGLDFVTFPALRFPMIGLLISRKEFPEKIKIDKSVISKPDLPSVVPPVISTGDIDFSLKGFPDYRSVLNIEFPLRRFVYDKDASSRVAIYSMFADNASAKLNGVNDLSADGRRSISEQLIATADKCEEPIVFLGDGQLAFQVSSLLVKAGFKVRVLPQEHDKPEFSFLSGIMFRDEAHKFHEHLAEAQRQIFRSSWRVIGFLQHFLQGVNDWLEEYATPDDNVFNLWRDANAPIVTYPMNQMISYLTAAYGHRASHTTAVDEAKHIYAQVEKYRQSLTYAQGLKVLFQKTGE
jgi:hypothetical protein